MTDHDEELDEFEIAYSLRFWIGGRYVDAKIRKNGVIHLRIGAQQYNGGLIRRMGQYLANTLFRLAYGGDPSELHVNWRVIKLVVHKESGDHTATYGRNLDIFKAFPICHTNHESDNEVSSQAFLFYEGIKNAQNGVLAEYFIVPRWNECAHDAHDYTSLKMSSITKTAPKYD